MKKKISMMFVTMVLVLLAATTPNNAQAQSGAQTFDQVASWASPSKDTGVPVGEILAELSAKYKFYWQLTPSTDQSILDRELAAELKPQPLRQVLTKLFSGLNTPVTFDGKLLLIGNTNTQEPATPLGYTTERYADELANNTDVPVVNPPAAMGMRTRPYNTPNPAIMEAQAEADAIQAAEREYQDIYGFGGPLYAATAPSRLGVPSAMNLAGIPDPNIGYAWPGAYRQPYGNVGYQRGRYGAYSGYGGYGYGYAQSPDQAFRQYFRNPQHLQTHGLLKISGPEDYLDKVRILVDGADVSVASDANNWNEQPIALPAGVRNITFIREDKGRLYRLERKVHIQAAGPQLSLTGKFKPTELRISRNEFENAEGTTLSVTQPVR